MPRKSVEPQDLSLVEQEYGYEFCLLYDTLWEEGVRMRLDKLKSILDRLETVHGIILMHESGIDGG